MHFHLDNTFTQELPADPRTENIPRQVTEGCYSYVYPTKPTAPKIVHVSPSVAELLGIADQVETVDFLSIFTGAELIPDSTPYAMCYGGHQFGHWAGQLGDGRAINLGEVVNNQQRWALQLKGSGRTPYSRTADGLAVLRSSVREHLCSEAMYGLGVPTTRSLSLALSGDQVLRDVMYDGHADYEQGAIVCRVSPSFVRFGNFQILAARRDLSTLAQLADHVIKHFYTDIQSTGKEAYVELFRQVAERTCRMVVEWQRVGFVHGVMNTDNMSILGLTIDYGPYGWLEGYDHGWTPNTTDRQQKRYRYGNQPSVGLWNLVQLANALVPIVEDPAPLQAVLDGYREQYVTAQLSMMRAKLGLLEQHEEDAALVEDLEEVLQLAETDMTIFFCLLADWDGSLIQDQAANSVTYFEKAFYDFSALTENILDRWQDWLQAYARRLSKEANSSAERKKKMQATNPRYVLRNYMAQLAIDKAEKGDYSLVEELYTMLQKPYQQQAEYEQWFAKRPEWARHKVGCSMLSCSS